MDLRTPARFAALAFWLLVPPSPSVASARDACPDHLEQTPAVPSCNGGGDAARIAPGPDPGAVPDTPTPRTTLGNPISIVTGTKFQQEIDFALPGAALTFRRHYSSAAADANIGLGHGWRHTFAVSVHHRGERALEIADSRGRRLVFELAADDGAGRRRFRTSLASDGYLERVESFTASGETRIRIVWHHPDGRTLRFHGSYLVAIDWPDQRALSLFYQRRRLASITDESGRVLRLEYTAGRVGLGRYERVDFQSQPGHLAALVLPDGRRIEYDYDGDRNLVRTRFADGTARLHHYEDPAWPSHLTGLTDRRGVRFATWAYDERGRAILSEHAGGVERVTLSHEAPDAVGDVGRTRVTASDGAASVYTWRREPASGRSQLLSARGPGCTTCPPTGRDYAYDAAGRLVSDTRLDDVGAPLRVTRHEHDELGRLVRTSVTLPDGTTRSIVRHEYDGANTRPSRSSRPSVNPDGERSTEHVFDAAGRLTSTTERGYAPGETGYEPIARTTRFGHDAGGRLVSIDGPREDVLDVTRLDWDDRSRLIAIRAPESPPVRLAAFDASGRPTEVRVGDASPYAIEYGEHGTVVAVRWRGSSIRYEHDAEGRPTATVDTDGRRTEFAYDDAGRPVRVTDDLGRTSTRLLDDENRVRERGLFGIDGRLVRSMAYVFDARGRIVAAGERRRHPSGRGETRRDVDFTHDAAGHLTGAIDRTSGTRTRHDVNTLAGLVTLTAADGSRTGHAFDVLGQPVAYTDARGNTTTFLVDDFGRTVSLDSPDTGHERYAHDPAGNRLRRERADGTVVLYRWDAAGRLVERRDADGTTSWRHDPTNGRLIEASNATSVERFEHDAEGQLLRHEREIDGRRHVTRYRHDERGRLVEKRLPDGQRLRYHYHEHGIARGTLRAITRARLLGLAEEVVVGEIDLDGRDGTSGHVAHNGLRTRTTHGPAGHVLHLDVERTLGLEYTFDDAGRIVGIDENGMAQRYAHDALRLSVADTLNGHYRYTYDEAGNRLSREARLPDGRREHERYAYPEGGDGNRLVRRTDAITGDVLTYRHDAGGAPLAAGDLRYAYDANRRPVSVHRGETLVARYAYNAFGERVRKTVRGPDGRMTSTRFLYDGPTLVAEIGDDGEVAVQYVYLTGHRPVARIEGRTLHAIHADHLGTPKLMTDDEGIVVWQARHEPFGAATLLVERVTLPLRLPGQYADAETGTHYNYLRDYDPAAGRYVTSDPIGLRGGTNTYAYAGGRPLSLADPLGLAPIAPAAAALPFAYGAASAFGTWLGSAALVTPIGLAGGAALIALAGVYWAVESRKDENSFEAALGRPADADEYNALANELRRYAPGLAGAGFLTWDGSWRSYFQIADELDRAQLAYAAQHERFLRDNPGTCAIRTDQLLYEHAITATDASRDGRRMAREALASGQTVLANPGLAPSDRPDGVPPFPASEADPEPLSTPVEEQGPTRTESPSEGSAPSAVVYPAEDLQTPTVMASEEDSSTAPIARPSGGAPALVEDPYHPDTVAQRQQASAETYGGFDSRSKAAELGYDLRIPPQRAPFDSHGQPVFYNGKDYITPDVDSHNVTNGWKKFNRRGRRTGTWNTDLTVRVND